MAWVPWEGNHVPDVADARHVHDQALKTQAKTRMGRRAVLAQVKVPLQALRLNVCLAHAAGGGGGEQGRRTDASEA